MNLSILNTGLTTGGNMKNSIVGSSILRRLTRLSCVLVSVWAVDSVAAESKATLKDLSFSSLPGGRFEVRMDFDQVPPEPAGYEIDKPARLVFDFNGVKNGLSTKKFALPFDNAQSAVVLGGEERTRLILNMNTLEVHQAHIEGTSYFIDIGKAKLEGPMVKAAGLADKLSSEINTRGASISDIDFRRGESGEGKILITLANPSTSVNVEQASGEIKLNFVDTQLPVNLRRKLDVTDFATPVLSLSATYDGKDSTISIKPQGDYDYMAYQADNLYVVSVKRLTAQQMEEKKSKFTYVGEKLSLNFQDIPVRSVLQIIADFTELNLVASDTVQGSITLRLDNVPWDQALDLVLKTKGLDKRQVGSVLMVAPASEIAEQERQAIETHKQLQELAPLHTEYIQILYANAKKLYDTLAKSADGKTPILSSRGMIVVDERTNSLVVTETDDKIQQIRDLLKRIDIPVRQVSIEARVVKATSDYAKSLGVRWGMAGNKNNSNNSKEILGSGSDTTITDYHRAQADGSTYEYLPGGLAYDFRATGGNVASYSIGYATRSLFTTLELSAIENEGRAEDVAQPKVITQDKQKATIMSGVELPYEESTSSGASTISFKEAALKLEVTPNITPDGNIMLNLVVTKASQSGSISGRFGSQIPIIGKTELNTNVLVNNGDTLVLGGVYENQRTNTVSKVPFFGDLPLLGALFRRNSSEDHKTELLIFLTPRILSDPLAKK